MQNFTLQIFAEEKFDSTVNLNRAEQTLNSLYKHFGTEGSFLLRETYPFDDSYKASYLDENSVKETKFSYLWPFSGTLSAITALYESTKDDRFLTFLKEHTLKGLEEYFDEREPPCYASYIKTAPTSDRFYDDNIWIAIDFADLYLQTKNELFLEKAKLIWTFILSGKDDKLGGGIYWCEQNRTGKHTCSNAPTVVLAMKLYEATNDRSFFNEGLSIYKWTKETLQDPSDKLYYDHIKLRGDVDKTKFAYNSGQMLQASALLYKHTGDESFLKEAQYIAHSSSERFFSVYTTKENDSFRLLNKRDIWFSAIMFRGFVELYMIDRNDSYITDFQKSLSLAWLKNRDTDGLFGSDWSGEEKEESKWLLTQAAMAEMYARMAMCKKNKD